MPKALPVVITVFLFSCFSGFNVSGQETPASKESAKSRTYALIIGISNYKYIRPLYFADSDAELFRDFLKSPAGGNLHDTNFFYLVNEKANQGNFVIQGLPWLSKINLQKGDKLYIYLAGHGDAINEDEFFFLTYDCNPAGDKNNYLLTGTVQVFTLKSRMKRLVQKGVQVIFIMDACRSNELPGKGSGQQSLQVMMEQQVGDIMMLAASAGEESLEDPNVGTGHGLFTYYLVDGLAGSADSSGTGVVDGKVTLEELRNYVSRSVSSLADQKFKRNQHPFFCCDKDIQQIVSVVDTAFLRKWIRTKQLTGKVNNDQFDYLSSKTFQSRARDFGSDTAIVDLYNRFTTAVKELNLTSSIGSAESIYEEMNRIAPTNSLTQEAKITLATEFVNFAQGKINLYLEGRDVSSIQRIRSQLDADDKSEDVTTSLDRMEKVARQDFSEVAHMLDKAMGYVEIDDEAYIRKLKAQNFFFKAHGYLERGGSTAGLKQAIQDAMQAYKADPKAAYILNTLASLQMDNNKPDSTIYFAKKAIELAPLWRYPYVNVANAFSKKNKPDSALVYYKKALAVDDSRADAYVDLGYFYFQQRKPDSARVYYEKALILDPTNAPANNNMGWLMRETKQFDQALIYFKKSLTYDHTFFNAYNGISRVFSDMGMFDSARIYYQKALKNYPDKLLPTNYLGQFYQEQNQVDSARIYFTQAAIYDPNYDASFINLGKLYVQMKRYDSAIFFFNKAIELNGKNFQGYNQLGLMYMGMKNYDSSFYYYRKGLSLSPDNTIVLNNLGLAYYENERYDSATAYYRKVIEISPANASAYNNIGLVYDKQKQPDSAIYYFTKALELQPGLISGMNNMGKVLVDKKDYDGGKYYFRKVLDQSPSNTFALTNLERIFKETNEFDSAIYYYERSISRGVRNSYLVNQVGYLHYQSERYDSAAKWYRVSIANDPNNPTGYSNLGTVYNSLQNYDSAVVMYKKALELDPNYLFALRNLGLVYHELKNYDSAIVYTQRSVRANPRNSLSYYYLALSYAKNNKPEEALRYLQQALERGYNNYEYIIAEQDLQSIKMYPAYRDMMKKHFPKKYKPADDE